MMELESIKTIANIGAGTMGHATALQFALKGYSVNLLDTSVDVLQEGIARMREDLSSYVKVGLVKAEEVDGIIANIHPTVSYEEGLEEADFVIESIVENLAVKKEVWQKVEKLVGPETILATNTSGLSPTKIAKFLEKPERFLVAHFYNPAHLMPLVEVVPAEKTNSAVVQTTVDLMNHIGKHAVALQKEAPGFVGNRIQAAVIRECLSIMQQGIATPETIDDIVKYSLGLRWSILGPVMSADLGGLDVFNTIITYLTTEISNEVGENALLVQKVKEGHFGQKSGQGFYDWQGEKGQELIDYRNQKLLAALVDEKKDK
ncbi:MAG TPA: 3-hydroxyacyl-CoA dehydrogenase family protein [Candidatus Tetragenococcus pullicola]|nr:3-hydroxyacyl-CoA dehydrogenase family protein [Candidatus Tetragenococcus pullicola]